MSAELNPKPFRPIQCRRQIRSTKGVDKQGRQQLEAMARDFTAGGYRLEDMDRAGSAFKINRVLRALQAELLHSEGWPTAE